AGDGLLALQDHPLQLLGEPACRLAHHTGEVADNTVREGQALALLHDVLRGQVVLGHEDGQVTHHLAGGRHLHNVAHHLIDLTVVLLDLHKPVAQAQRLHLGLQVGVLTAGDLVAVNIRGIVLQA
ncbi:50S ribosomal protein L7/L12, partial [Dysosmobacter welbionis]